MWWRSRGGLMQALPAGGAMIAVQASESEVLPLLGDRVDSRRSTARMPQW